MKTTVVEYNLITEAFNVLLKNLGLRKTAQLWQILAFPGGDYVKMRRKLFTGKNVDTLYQEAKKFNRK